MRKQAQIITVLFTQVGAGTSLRKAGWDKALCMFHGQQNTAAAKCSGHEQCAG